MLLQIAREVTTERRPTTGLESEKFAASGKPAVIFRFRFFMPVERCIVLKP